MKKMVTFCQTCPLTVMLLIDVLDQTGGAERSLYLLAKGLRKRGHRVIICCLKGGELSNTMRKNGFHLESLSIRKIYDYRGLRALLRLIRIVRRERVDVIVSYHESSDFLGVLVAWLTNTSIISSRRDMGFKLKLRHMRLYRFVNCLFDRIVAVSFAVKEFIIKTQGTKPSDVVVIHNGAKSSSITDKVSAPAEGFRASGFDEDFLKVCCLANIRPIKGHKHLIEAASMVIKRFSNVRFFFIGDYDVADPYFAELQRQIKTLGLDTAVKITGELARHDVPEMLTSMDISVLSSLSEGMSNTLLESMSAGKPIVATAVGGNLELVEDGKTGYLVPPCDPHSMAKALLRLLNSPKLRREMGLRARSRVESEFSVTRMVERYEDLLQYVYLRRKLGRWHRFHSTLPETFSRVRFWYKTAVASVLYFGGLIALCRLIKRAFRKGRVKILCLHDISNLAKARPQFSVHIDPDSFSGFLNFLVKNYNVVSLEEAVRLLEAGQSLKDDVFALTFDDYYKGWINHVLPVCQLLLVPFTVFVTTEPLDSARPLLFDALVFLGENTWRKVLDLSRWHLGTFLLGNKGELLYFVESVHEHWRGRSRDNCIQFLRELSEYLGVSLNPSRFQNIMLNWADVHKLDMNGVTIGAHGISHRCLRDLDEADCSWEIYDSKMRLERELGHPIRFFAYPYGILDYYDRDTTKVVAKAGFRNAFTLGVHDSKRFRPFEIGRRTVSRGMFADPDGNPHESLLAMELCGLGDLVFGRVFWRKIY